jgi:WD40 repeat protein
MREVGEVTGGPLPASAALVRVTGGGPVGPPDCATGVAFSPDDDEALAVAGGGGAIVVWNIKTFNTTTAKADPDNAEITDVAYNSRGDRLATLSIDNRIYLWNVARA